MDILIVSHFGSTYSENDNDRFLYLAKMLSKEHNVEIVTSSFCHEKKIHRRVSEGRWSFNITFINEPGYKKNVCIQRFYSHYIFGINLYKYIKNRKKPDVIYCAVPSLTGPALIAKYCTKKNIRFLIDIQDLWPEAFQMVLNIPIISNALFFPFKVLANMIYKNADEIVGVSDSYVKRGILRNKKNATGYSVYLGTDLSIFDNNVKKRKSLKKDNKEIWLCYCGTLGSSYDLNCVFDALKEIKNRGGDVPKFVIMGDGPLLEKFENYAKRLQLDTVFTGRIPYDKMCSYLCSCDIAINPIMHDAAQSIINKHADYVASGLPIISTQENKEFVNLIEEYKMGINCTNGNIEELANAILFLMNNTKERINMGKNARRCAEEKFDRKNIYTKILKVILDYK